jgi:CYTH domain-containing protein
LPDWLGREVTGDAAWSNATLAANGLPAEARP